MPSEHDKYAAVWPLWCIGIGVFFLSYAYGIRYSPIGERFGLGFLAIGLTWQLGVRVLVRRGEEVPPPLQSDGFHVDDGSGPDTPPVVAAPRAAPAEIPPYQDDDATMVPAPSVVGAQVPVPPPSVPPPSVPPPIAKVRQQVPDGPPVLEEATVMTHVDDYDEAVASPRFDDPTDPSA